MKHSLSFLAPRRLALIDANRGLTMVPRLCLVRGGYHFTSSESLGAGAVVPEPLLHSAVTPLAATTGTSAYCAVDDGVVRTQPAGNIALVFGYGACQLLNPPRLTNIVSSAK